MEPGFPPASTKRALLPTLAFDEYRSSYTSTSRLVASSTTDPSPIPASLLTLPPLLPSRAPNLIHHAEKEARSERPAGSGRSKRLPERKT